MGRVMPQTNDARDQFSRLTAQRVLAYDRLWDALQSGIGVRSADEDYCRCKQACIEAAERLSEQEFNAKEAAQ